MNDKNRHLTILLVESDDIARNLLRTFLQQNYRMLVAASGHEALELSRRYKGSIHIFLSPSEMAGANGVPLHWQVGAERPGIKTLLFGDKSLPGSHATPFLKKPFDLGALHDKLEAFLQRDAARNTRVILVADEDSERRERFRRILAGWGHCVLVTPGPAKRETTAEGVSAIEMDPQFSMRLPVN